MSSLRGPRDGENRLCDLRQIHLLSGKVWGSLGQLPAWTL